LKGEGKKIASTNGSFDLLHAGHVFLLEEAKKQGDVLIVGVNSDSSVRQYKSPDRPIVPQAERALLVAALGCVDFVTIFDEPSCLKFVESVKPHVHVKDANWADAKGRLLESETVEKFSGKVFLVKRKEGLSTTDIIEKILSNYCEKRRPSAQ
jgi:rfaE bifunctional protein nucleotidyltransferase chain/domain